MQFIEYFGHTYTPYTHQMKIAQIFNNLVVSYQNYLMMLPPQSGKSTIALALYAFFKQELDTVLVSYTNKPNMIRWQQYDPTKDTTELLIIDDPIKSVEEAEDEAVQHKLQRWLTAIPPKTRVVCLLTRWSVNDIAGWILNYGSGVWVINRVSAIREGVPYCKDLCTLKGMKQIQQTIGYAKWEAMYQQQPIWSNLYGN